MKRIFLVLIFFFIFFNSFCQYRSVEGVRDSTKRIDVFPEVGYIWQGYNNIEGGVKLMYFTNKKQTHENVSLILGCNFFKHYVTYASPFVTLKYYKVIKIPINISCSYWQTTVHGIRDQRITPEIGIAIGAISISYGYNIPISSDKISFITPSRVAIRLISF
jgi:hypothetical protein